MENTADVEYYTNISENTRKKWRETPTSGCACAHPSIPSVSRGLRSQVAMVLVLLYYLYYNYSKKKARETEKKSTGNREKGRETRLRMRTHGVTWPLVTSHRDFRSGPGHFRSGPLPV